MAAPPEWSFLFLTPKDTSYSLAQQKTVFITTVDLKKLGE